MRPVGTQSAELHLATPAPDILRIVFSPTGTLAITDDGVLEHTVGVPSGQPVSLADATKTLSFGQFQVNVANDPVALRVTNPAGHLIQKLQFAPDESLRFDLGIGPLFGLGQGGPQFDRRGSFPSDGQRTA